jgi:hypothetical protein
VKNPLKKSRILQDNSITNLKFQHKPKISSFKNPHLKIDLLSRGQIPLSYYILYNESKYNIFCLGRQGRQTLSRICKFNANLILIKVLCCVLNIILKQDLKVRMLDLTSIEILWALGLLFLCVSNSTKICNQAF